MNEFLENSLFAGVDYVFEGLEPTETSKMQ